MTLAFDDSPPIRGDVPISMHPDSLLGIAKPLNQQDTVGISALSAAREALKICHDTFGQLNDAEAAIRKSAPRGYRRQHPSGQTEIRGNVRMVDGVPSTIIDHEALLDAAEKAFTRITPAVDRRMKELKGYREALSKRVATALDDPMRKTPEGLAVASEVRAYVKGLPDKDRLQFVSNAISTGDKATVAAVLHAQPFLSGLNDKDQAVIRARAANQFAGVDAGQLDATEAAILHVQHAGNMLTKRYSAILALRNEPNVVAAKKIRELANGKA